MTIRQIHQVMMEWWNEMNLFGKIVLIPFWLLVYFLMVMIFKLFVK